MCTVLLYCNSRLAVRPDHKQMGGNPLVGVKLFHARTLLQAVLVYELIRFKFYYTFA